MSQRSNSGFVLWELLLLAYVSMGLIISFCYYWRYWSRAIDVLYQRAHILQIAIVLPDILLARWREVSDFQGKRSHVKVVQLSAKVYQRNHPRSLIPLSSVFFIKWGAGSTQLEDAYFLSRSMGSSKLSLYEKRNDLRAKPLVAGLLSLSCHPVDSNPNLLIDCVYTLPWAMIDKKQVGIKIFEKVISLKEVFG